MQSHEQIPRSVEEINHQILSVQRELKEAAIAQGKYGQFEEDIDRLKQQLLDLTNELIQHIVEDGESKGRQSELSLG